MSSEVVVVYFPRYSNNKYVELSVAAISKSGFKVVGVKAWLKEVYKFKKIVFVFNWLEDHFYLKNGTVNYGKLFFSIFFLMVSRFFGKILWVRHNIKPHVYKKRSIGWFYFVRFLLNRFSKVVVSHSEGFSKHSGVRYIPHPMYPVKKKADTKIFRFHGVILGAVLPYKQHLKILELWPKTLKLAILGYCPDTSYKKKLEEVIRLRGLAVCFWDEYKSSEFVDSVLSQSMSLVVCSRVDTSIVSGTVFHGLSSGLPIFDFSESVKFDYFSIPMQMITHFSRSLNDVKIEDELKCKRLSFDRSRLEPIIGNSVFETSWTNVLGTLV